jgi:hypothetical protein
MTRVVAALMPITNDPEFVFTKLKKQFEEIFLKVGSTEFKKDDLYEAVRTRQDAQRYARAVNRAHHWIKREGYSWKRQGSKCDQLETILPQHFTRNKWDDGDFKKVVSHIVTLQKSNAIRRYNPLARSSGLNWRGPEKIRFSWEDQQTLKDRCKTQDWPGICSANLAVLGRGKKYIWKHE